MVAALDLRQRMKRESLSKLGRRSLLTAVGVGALSGVAFTGCGGDEAPTFELVVISDSASLTADGTDAAVITVSVLDESFNPPAQGTTVTLQGLSATGALTGNVNDSGQSVAQAPTDQLGFSQFSFQCTEPGQIVLLARFGDARKQLLLTCGEPPSGDWTLAVTAEPRRIGTQSASTVSVTATQGDGSPVPTDTPIVMEVTAGDMAFSRGGTTLNREADAAGRTSATVASGTLEGTATVCASFVDARFGNTPACVGIVVSDREVTDATCIGTLSSARSPADGISVTVVTYTVADSNGNPIADSTVVTEVAAGLFVSAPNAGSPIGTEQTLTTDSNGDAIAYLRSPDVGGSAEISGVATIIQDGVARDLSCSFDSNLVYFGAPSCRFGGMEPSIIGVTNSGIEESGTVTFCFESSRGVPVEPNTRVEFEFGLKVTGLEANSQSALTDQSGCASIEVTAGEQAGLFEVRATVPFGTSESTCTSTPLPIRHGRPTATGWNFQCETSNVGALTNSSGDEIFSDCAVQCQGYLRDRFGNPVNSPETLVYFASEQGTIQSPVSPDANGRFVTSYNPNGNRPRNVEPIAGEPSVVDTVTGDIINPRDMFVTLVAWTNGEEGFDDTDGDGFYTDGEVFIDLSEPYVDNNDNDEFNPEFPITDRFVDVETSDRDANGIWDPENLVWDQNTVIWTRTGVVLSGEPVVGPIDEPFSPGPGSDRDNFSYISNGTAIRFPNDGFAPNPRSPMLFHIADPYLNFIGNNTTVTFSLSECQAYDLDDGTFQGLIGPGFQYSRVFQTYDSTGSLVVGSSVASKRWETVLSFPAQDLSIRVPIGYTDDEGVEDCLLEITVSIQPTAECGDTYSFTYGPWILEQ
jgi:hypothetical protein